MNWQNKFSISLLDDFLKNILQMSREFQFHSTDLGLNIKSNALSYAGCQLRLLAMNLYICASTAVEYHWQVMISPITLSFLSHQFSQAVQSLQKSLF